MVASTTPEALAASAAKTFVDTYYTSLDTRRGNLPSFYHPSAGIVWNGNTLTGGDAFGQFFSQMPTTIHDVQSYDAHKIADAAGGKPVVSLAVSGTVKYGESKEVRGFSETVVLSPEEGAPAGGAEVRYRIRTQAFRVVTA